ncbi:quinoprotein dehydrogenase-associated SoxYZ-like carrier [Hyphomicrobium sp. CS1GBMeth3]|uniref:quinoprotein dehydrogenase-associated SoxYZ-like carrier n=1 Tax=Hyphomicrobium sp. CS1GBMeth3 TaxID=1892845 RepID=UPI00092FDA3B|nr:quinoprotein dehydrogenase-associated SoxYZ-like carrier [Hyphomicrobium sp. CS1GBMeth3]
MGALIRDTWAGRWSAWASVAVVCLGAWSIPAEAAAEQDLWTSLRAEVFADRAIAENDGVVLIEAPDRAEDAALVPVTVRVPPDVKGALKSLTLIIDQNPAPVAVSLTFGPAAGEGGGERRFSTRVRIDTYSYVRAIVETADGQLHMASTFVKASGGCSAPAPKDIDGTSANLGKIVARSFEPALPATPLREAQVMIRHPNINGLQMDPVTRAYTPARFVRDVTVTRGSDLVFRTELSISISADPHFRFTYGNSGDGDFDVVAVDTDEAVFKGGTRHKGL